jgi:hypothetical protein
MTFEIMLDKLPDQAYLTNLLKKQRLVRKQAQIRFVINQGKEN